MDIKVSENSISSFTRMMITITVMSVAIIEVLDMTIVNVALTPMMGALGADTDQITWILTSYIVSAAIFMPLTGFLVTRVGQKKLLLFNIIGFLSASVLCGIATSLPEMVLFRTCQGIFGASLVPLSQSILRNTYRKEEIGKAMAIWGIGITVAPVLGPTLGGYITEYLSWRWIFYINAPVCIFAFLMTLHFIPETIKKNITIDWLGLTLMIVGIGCLQIFLDRGNNDDWFQSHVIVILFFIATVALSFFIHRGFTNANNIVNLKLYRDRNFALSSILMFLFSLNVFAVIAIQPILMENILGYPTELAGLTMAPRGLAAAVGMIMTSKLISRIDYRLLMLCGILIISYGIFTMSGFNLLTAESDWMLAGAIQGLGMGLFFVPLSSISLSTLNPTDIAEGSGLFSLSRSIGSSIGISAVSTIITRETQINWNRLGEHINIYNSNLQLWLHQQGWQTYNPAALQILKHQLTQQASIVAFIDSFRLINLSLLLCIPFILLLKNFRDDKVNQSLVNH